MAVGTGSGMIVPAARMPAAIALTGPGHFGRAGASGAMIFDAGEDIKQRDALAYFYGEEIFGLLWVEDYLRDQELLYMMANLEEKMPGLEEELESDEVYDKRALTSTGMDTYDDAGGSGDS